ncbi:MAG: nicotinate-nucleotide adenylyltransferase [Lachnospiraceae bacterium]|nr:nicotinate-nucleotide adenylyltransferase [Lachnospiraceae bacterium]
MGRKIGIMGGTFNPIHNGHLLLAEDAREFFKLDEVIFMPSGNSYMKNTASILNGEIRAEMISLAIESNPHFSFSRIELDREGPTYTCDTLKELKQKNDEDQYFFIMGADSLLMLECWKNPEYIMHNCTLAVAVRGTGTEEKIEKIAAHLIYEYQADIRILPARYMDISSSEIRSRIEEGKSIRYMLPENVCSYMETKGLYNIIS